LATDQVQEEPVQAGEADKDLVWGGWIKIGPRRPSPRGTKHNPTDAIAAFSCE